MLTYVLRQLSLLYSVSAPNQLLLDRPLPPLPAELWATIIVRSGDTIKDQVKSWCRLKNTAHTLRAQMPTTFTMQLALGITDEQISNQIWSENHKKDAGAIQALVCLTEHIAPVMMRKIGSNWGWFPDIWATHVTDPKPMSADDRARTQLIAKAYLTSTANSGAMVYYILHCVDGWNERFETAIDLAHFMIDNGADVNCADAKGTTLLHLAIEKHLPDTVAKLLEHGANIQVRSTQYGLPLDQILGKVIPRYYDMPSDSFTRSRGIQNIRLHLTAGQQLAMIGYTYGTRAAHLFNQVLESDKRLTGWSINTLCSLSEAQRTEYLKQGSFSSCQIL